MGAVIFVRPQSLGLEAQSALARLVPRFGQRLMPATVVVADPAGDAR